MKALTMLVLVFICGGCAAIGEYLSEDQRTVLAEQFTDAAERVAKDPSILNTANELAGAAALTVFAVAAEWLRRRNKKSDLRKVNMEADIAALKKSRSVAL